MKLLVDSSSAMPAERLSAIRSALDKLLAQSGSFRDHQVVAERAMDRNDLERERGITILAKCTSVVWNDIRINIGGLGGLYLMRRASDAPVSI